MYESVRVQILANGVVRVYGDGGLVFETSAEYVRVETSQIANVPYPSGTVSHPK